MAFPALPSLAPPSFVVAPACGCKAWFSGRDKKVPFNPFFQLSRATRRDLLDAAQQGKVVNLKPCTPDHLIQLLHRVAAATAANGTIPVDDQGAKLDVDPELLHGAVKPPLENPGGGS